MTQQHRNCETCGTIKLFDSCWEARRAHWEPITTPVAGDWGFAPTARGRGWHTLRGHKASASNAYRVSNDAAAIFKVGTATNYKVIALSLRKFTSGMN